MYTVDDEKRDLYEDELNDAVYYENRKGIIFKIIIIILCVIVLIWLIKALRTNNNKVDLVAIHDANVEKVRLASEKYFFLDKNMDKSSVSLNTLKTKGLIGDVVDANNKVCDTNNSTTKLVKEASAYKMTINLSCSTNEKEETFYYHGSTLACLNCNGKTNMDGKTIVVYNDPKEEEEVETNDDNNIPDDYDEYNKYSCVNWSDWSKDRVFDPSLTERSKTLVLGVKKGTGTQEKVYGEWSSYTTNPITPNDNLEVETKTETYNTWSSNKTTNKPIKESSTIRIISTSGNNVSKNEKVGNLTVTEYLSGNYDIKNNKCEGLEVLPNKEGKNVLTYTGCRYTEKNSESSEEVTYTYQELETTSVTYYRSRTVTINDTGADIYTTDRYEESELPDGYVKVPGSEETYYSYKLTYCEK